MEDENKEINLNKGENQNISKKRNEKNNNELRNSFSYMKLKERFVKSVAHNENVLATKSDNKKKFIAIIFGIVFVISTAILALTLIIETLNFLVFIIPMAVVVVMTFIITIALIISICRSNKTPELGDIQNILQKQKPEGNKNLHKYFNLGKYENDNEKIRRNSWDFSKPLISYKGEQKK